MFRRKKAVEKVEYYYDDDYYYDDYYYDDYDEDDAETEKQDEDKPAKEPKQDKRKESKKGELSETATTDLEEAISSKQAEIDKLKQENADLKAKFATVSALPKHYQQLEADNGVLRQEIETTQASVTSLEERLVAATEQAATSDRHFQQEINAKQTDIDQLTEKLLNVESPLEEMAALTTENEALKNGVQELTQKVADLTQEQEELTQAKEEFKNEAAELFDSLATSKEQENQLMSELVALKKELLENESDITKNDIADVLIDAKAKARQIVEQSKYEASRIVSEAEKELLYVTNKAENLYTRIYNTKVESTDVFEELLGKLSDLSGHKDDPH